MVLFLIDASTVLPMLLRDPDPAAPREAPRPDPAPKAPEKPIAVTEIWALIVEVTLTRPLGVIFEESIVAINVMAISLTAAAPAPANEIPLPDPTPSAIAPAPASAMMEVDAVALTDTAPDRSVLFTIRAFTAETTLFIEPEPAPLPATPTPETTPAPTAPASVKA